MILSQAIIADIVPAKERGKYMGPLGAIFGLSAVAGPLLGGFFIDHLTWQWCFYINIPVGIAAFTIAWFTLTLPSKKAGEAIDIARRGAAVRRHHLPDLLHRFRRQEGRGLGLAADLALRRRAWCSRLSPSSWSSAAQRTPIIPLSPVPQPRLRQLHRHRFHAGPGHVRRDRRSCPTFLQMSSGTSAAVSGLLMLPMMVGLMGTAIGSGIAITSTGRYKIFPIPGTAVTIAAMLWMTTLTGHHTDLGHLRCSCSCSAPGSA